MTTFYMLCGLPGSGKSYYAREKAQSNDVIVSSDSIREELYGDASIQENPALIFSTMFQRTRAALWMGRNVFYDATNINSKRRINLLKQLKKDCPGVHYICVIIATPIDVCHERNGERERVVPFHVIDRMLRQFEMPYEGEGWDEILIHYNYASNYDIDYYRDAYTTLVKEYGDQGNTHHTRTLQEHCEECRILARQNIAHPDIVQAAFLHDYGKVWTAIRWEKDEYKELHYPSHANVSCYMALTMGYNAHVAQLIAYHMIPYTDQKCQDTWHSRLGEELWKEIIELHSYDEEAH